MTDVGGVNDDLLDRLAASAAPVRRVDERQFMAFVGVAGLLSALTVLLFIGPRADLGAVFMTPAFLWKFGAMALVAAVALPMLMASGRPGARPARVGRVVLATLATLGLPLVYAVATQPMAESMRGLEATRGLACLGWTIIASVPVWLASLTWLRAAAPTNQERASWAAGLASAAVGASFFVLHCPYDDIVYVAVWYGTAIAGIAVVTRLVMPRLIRW